MEEELETRSRIELLREAVVILLKSPIFYIVPFFAVILAEQFEKFTPVYGKYISIVIGIGFVFLIYPVIRRRSRLSKEELAKEKTPTYVYFLSVILFASIYAYLIWYSVNRL